VRYFKSQLIEWLKGVLESSALIYLVIKRMRQPYSGGQCCLAPLPLALPSAQRAAALPLQTERTPVAFSFIGEEKPGGTMNRKSPLSLAFVSMCLVAGFALLAPAALHAQDTANPPSGHWEYDPAGIATPAFVYNPPPAGFNPLTATDAQISRVARRSWLPGTSSIWSRLARTSILLLMPSTIFILLT
jgi:hypothetical protein